MSWADQIMNQSKLIVSVTAILAFAGVAGLLTMPKQEDPRLKDRNGIIVIPYPGADPLTIERLVIKPLEDELNDVDDIKTVVSTARPGVATIVVRLLDRTNERDIEKAWDDVQDAIDAARAEFPSGVQRPELNRELFDLEAVVVAVTGSNDPLVLRSAAIKIKDELFKVDDVARITLVADPGEQVSIRFDEDAAQKMGLDRRWLVLSLAESSTALTSGSLRIGDRRAGLDSVSSFDSLDEIKRFPLQLLNGRQVPLSSLAQVVTEPESPALRSMTWNGEKAIALGVIPRRDVDVVRLGREIRSELQRLEPLVAPLKIEEIAFQPDRTEDRLMGLLEALLEGIVGVTVVLMIWMGLRMGLIVALSVPLISVLGLTAYFVGGGVIHQISIAAFVIAIGQFIDNVIVVTESAQRRMNEGADAQKAARDVIDEFKLPMIFATGTAVAAFLPMLASQGATADFTFAIPLIAVITLVVSYFYAIMVAPLLAARFLKPSLASQRSNTIERVGNWIGRSAGDHPWFVVGGAALFLAVSLALLPSIKKQFFPEADRNEFVINLELPSGSDLSATERASQKLVSFLKSRQEVRSVAAFAGGGMPQFYYNLPRVPRASHVAQLLVVTDSPASNRALAGETRAFAREQLPEARLLARFLEQGPPVDAPIEVRLQGTNLEDLDASAFEVEGALRSTAGTRDVRSDAEIGSLRVRIPANDAGTARFGLTRNDVTLSLLKESSGLTVGQYRAGREPVPIVLTHSRSDEPTLNQLLQTQVAAIPQGSIRVADLARPELTWTPALITRRNGIREISVRSDLESGSSYNSVLSQLRGKIATLQLPSTVRIAFGGQEEGAEEANTAIFKALPLAVIVLLICLLLEFRSFRKIMIIMLSIPLVLAGVLPGLALGQAAFGFMSLLGILALVGIVVNNSILLFEAIESMRADGMSLDETLRQAVSLRLRPILLTTVSTVIGLIPLAFEESTLWPPLAWTMISGILASAILSVGFIPALYKIFFAPKGLVSTRKLAGFAILAFAAAPTANAQTGKDGLTLDQAMDLAQSRNLEVASQQSRVIQSSRDLDAVRSRAYAPRVDAQASYTARDRDWNLVTPAGNFPVGERAYGQAAAQVTQPLFNRGAMVHGVGAASAFKEAEQHRLEWMTRIARAEAGRAFLQVLMLDAEMKSARDLIETLSRQSVEIDRLFALGRVFEADRNQVRLALSDAEHSLVSLQQQQLVLKSELARVTGVSESQHNLRAPEVERLGRAFAAKGDITQGQRPDLLMLEALIRGEAESRDAVRARGLPTLSLQGRVVHNGQRQFNETEWAEAQVVLNWSVFEGGARSAETQAKEAAVESLRRRREYLVQSIDLEITENLAALTTLADRSQRSEKDLIQARIARDRQLDRYRQGKVAYSEALSADLAYTAQKRLAARLPFERAQAYLSHQLAVGQVPRLGD